MAFMHGNPQRTYIKSSSFFMAALYTILCGIAALILGYFINYFAQGHLLHNTSALLKTEVKYALSQENIEEGIHGDRLYFYMDTPQDWPAMIPPPAAHMTEDIYVFDIDKKRYAATMHPLENDQMLLVGYDITEVTKDFKFMQYMGIISIIFVMIVVFISYLISIFVVNGTNRIAGTAQDIIDTGDLSRRLDVTSKWDDLGNMALVLNNMFDRIEELMDGVRRVSDNIAHDLRTPLTRLKNNIEDLQKKYDAALPSSSAPNAHPLTADDIQNLMDETDHILNIFNALLRIARIENEQRISQFQDVDIAAIMDDVLLFYLPLAEEKDITVSTQITAAPYYGDRDLLFQAFANMISNAIKYTARGGHIDIGITQTAENRIQVSIADNGIGISAAEKDKIFDRFYRAESSRSTQGVGLGLSLVKTVMDLHKARIEIVDNMPGFKIITIL